MTDLNTGPVSGSIQFGRYGGQLSGTPILDQIHPPVPSRLELAHAYALKMIADGGDCGYIQKNAGKIAFAAFALADAMLKRGEV